MAAPCRFVCRKFFTFSNGIKAANVLQTRQVLAAKQVVRHASLMSKKTRPTLVSLWKRRQEQGPEPERPRSVYPNWNYDAEIFAFGKRLGEEFDPNILKTALTHSSYADKLEREAVAALEFQQDEDEKLFRVTDNTTLSEKGQEIVDQYLPAYLRHCLPRLPEECIRALHDYLTTQEMVTHIALHLGIKDLILCDEFPVLPDTMVTTFCAVIGALAKSQGEARAQQFVQDFFPPQLLDKDLSDIWGDAIHDPMGILSSMLEKEGRGAPEPRLLFEAGRSTVVATYQVGIYSDKQLLGRSFGETTTIAEEMAARDALRRVWGTTISTQSLPLGDKGRSLQIDVQAKNHRIEDYKLKQVGDS